MSTKWTDAEREAYRQGRIDALEGLRADLLDGTAGVGHSAIPDWVWVVLDERINP